MPLLALPICPIRINKVFCSELIRHLSSPYISYNIGTSHNKNQGYFWGQSFGFLWLTHTVHSPQSVWSRLAQSSEGRVVSAHHFLLRRSSEAINQQNNRDAQAAAARTLINCALSGRNFVWQKILPHRNLWLCHASRLSGGFQAWVTPSVCCDMLTVTAVGEEQTCLQPCAGWKKVPLLEDSANAGQPPHKTRTCLPHMCTVHMILLSPPPPVDQVGAAGPSLPAEQADVQRSSPRCEPDVERPVVVRGRVSTRP